MLGTLHLPTTGGVAYSWEVIGQSLLELHAMGSRVTAQAVRAFCRKLSEPAPPRLGRKGGATGDGIDWTQHISETP